MPTGSRAVRSSCSWSPVLPRALVGVLAGLALGAGGATFRLMARNPLASPDVLGLTMGASAAAVLTLVVLGGSGTAVAVAALLGPPPSRWP